MAAPCRPSGEVLPIEFPSASLDTYNAAADEAWRVPIPDPPESESPGALAGASGVEANGKAGCSDHSTTLEPRKFPAQRAWDERNPLAKWAHSATRSALRKGLIERQPCAVCGDPRADAHHPDHTRPLQVQWLCRSHHRRLHAGGSSQ